MLHFWPRDLSRSFTWGCSALSESGQCGSILTSSGEVTDSFQFPLLLVNKKKDSNCVLTQSFRCRLTLPSVCLSVFLSNGVSVWCLCLVMTFLHTHYILSVDMTLPSTPLFSLHPYPLFCWVTGTLMQQISYTEIYKNECCFTILFVSCAFSLTPTPF